MNQLRQQLIEEFMSGRDTSELTNRIRTMLQHQQRNKNNDTGG